MDKPIFTNRSLARLIGPLILEQLLAVTIGMADTIMVTGVGEHAVSAISLVDAINLLLINVFSALGTGDELAAMLMERRIAAVNGGSAYGKQGEGYIRIIHGSMGSDEQVRQALENIAAFFREVAAEKGITE